MPRLKQNDNSIYDKALSWFWVLLFLSAVFYLRWLLIDMHVKTAQLSIERERLSSEIESIQYKNERFQREFNASVEEALEGLRNIRY